MWLDRFSGNSSPAGASTPTRSYSPLPRKGSHLAPIQRIGLGLHQTRSSTSLDLSTNASTTSLPSPTRLVNGSALRYEQKPPPDVIDPLKVLRSILGIPDEDGAVTGGTQTSTEHNVATNDVVVDFGGLSLQEFAEQDIEDDHAMPESLQQETLKDHQLKYEEFHNSMSDCDDVLKTVETYLTNFKAELGEVSAEIENLQARSIQLNAKLNNRRNVEKLLGPSVEEISLAPSTIRAIAEGPIDDAFVRALHEVETQFIEIDSKDSKAESIKALEDLRPLLNDLKSKAIERIRDFVVSQIKALRSPNINAQVIQQQKFLKYKEIFAFLARNHPVLAEEICQAYVNTMKWYYGSNFGRYEQALEKVQLYIFDQRDLLGTDPATQKRNPAAKGPSQHQDPFSLGKRGDILKAKHENAIPSYLAEDGKSTHGMEVPFQNFNLALMDNLFTEYSVATEYFTNNSYHQVSRRVIETFEPTFTLGQNLTKQLVESTTDCLGILLCVRLNQHFAFEMQRRKVPVADSYINYTNILLWPRFQKIMDLHCESLKRVPTGGARSASAAFSLVGGNDSSKASVAPHAITQRFGQFLHGILALSAEAGDDEPVSNSLGRLRGEYETLITKMAKNAGDSSKRNRFLYNNYSLISTIISDTQGRLAEEQKEHFGTLVRDLKGK